MAKKQIEKLSGKSKDITEEQINAFKNLFPQAVKDGKIDFDVLKQLLSNEIESPQQSYGLSWAGKNECFRHIQETTPATLKPVRAESVDFDNTENIFIESDNLEVLKVLQANYYGKIKMIYIDPPYNTGNDSFIYPDKFKEEKGEYEQRAGIRDAEGLLTKDGFWRKNSKDSGHFHSTWLSMMYPRLFLAKNLLRQDGVIFVSIDDNEVHNLRMIMNEIFGEENFIAEFIIRSNPRGSQSTKNSAIVHDYLLCFCRNSETTVQLQQELTPEMKEEYSEAYIDGRKYRLLGLRLRGGAWRRQDRPLLFYPMYVNPQTAKISLSKSKDYSVEVLPIQPTTGQEGTWRWNKKKVEQNINLLIAKQVKRNDELEWDILQYDFLEVANGEDRKTKPKTIWDEKDVNYERGTEEVKQLFDNKGIFNFPKPTGLLKRVLNTAFTDTDDIILDFFAGSCTTADAVMQLNAEDNGNRKFICVQLAEPCEEESEAFKAGFKTIADIGKERIRRAAKKIKEENKGKLDFDGSKLDLGFKVFKLNESNFKQWQENVKTADELKEQMKLFVNNTKKGTPAENMLYEIILKNSRFDLNVKAEKKTFDGVEYYSIANGIEGICLADKITKKFIEKVIELKPEKFTCLDTAFKNNDQLKTNTALQMDAEKIEFKVI